MGWLARELGSEKFGIFLIAFSVLGYASIFDAGLTRAVIRFLALKNNDKNTDSEIIGTATISVVFLGSLGTALLFYFSVSIISYLKVSASYYADVLSSFHILSLIILPTLVSMIWFAFPEGKQDFFRLSIYKAISGFFIAVCPLLTVLIVPSLTSAMLGFLIGRVISLIISFIPIYLVFNFRFLKFSKNTLVQLFSFGGWITVSNIISPIMVHSDRFILSNYVGASQVALYAAPAEVITRMGVVPISIARTLFPLFSNSMKDSAGHAKNANIGMILILFLMVTPVFLLSDFLLAFWLGDEFAINAGLILQILLVGFFFNSLAQIPFARIQAYGKSKLTAIIHLLEVVPYLLLLFYLVNAYGLMGAAIAWSLRVTLDYTILLWFAHRLNLES